MKVFIRHINSAVPVRPHWDMVLDKSLWGVADDFVDGMPKPENYIKFIAGRKPDRRFAISRAQAAPGLPLGWKEATFIGSEEALQCSLLCSTLQPQPAQPQPQPAQPQPQPAQPQPQPAHAAPQGAAAGAGHQAQQPQPFPENI